MASLAGLRFLPALIGGIVIALALFLLMHGMISGKQTGTSNMTQVNLVNFVRVERQPPVTTKTRVHPPPPPPAKNPPPKTQVETTRSSNVQPSQLPVNVQLDTNALGGGTGVFIGNPNAAPATDASGGAPLTPMVRIKPLYPPQAQYQGVQGTVSTCFTVNPDGSVSNPHVTHASSPQARQMLSQAALQTIRQWKFFPKKVNGKGVPATACQDITFTIGQGGGQ